MSDKSDFESLKPSPAITRAWVRLMRTQQIVLAAIEQDLKAADLPPLGWYDVLLELARATGGRLRPYEIEERTLLAQHNLSRLLDRMEKAGFVHREIFSEDGRGRWVVITEAGSAMQSRMWAVYASALQRHLGDKLDDAQADQLAELLAVLSRAS
ncbi:MULTISPECIES: MarR family winged helix-turn-helix transcriptional regulator [unclassified Rhizobium]|uniref:MarR family winged helix-turn-helix transcriptional regulator n=1 Tax=unclassified Rhizobium TaxID=2613769 RepID=UPI000CDF3DCA|nr:MULTISPECIES: MarR family winged helix-turn-helix transcriptional regulator [Rhizobium]AVA23307.1 MarR family transcriptional regulator protein [Rhizobium sp. NXC24]MDK4739706.1 MarR family winged helix-turn-helix transcriptional regulator [Rhizobium sp. CNPSo 3464]UWU23366.1 MarR family winged helix-turn-helix transcriptional regulator [Rhizobium tropici]